MSRRPGAPVRTRPEQGRGTGGGGATPLPRPERSPRGAALGRSPRRAPRGGLGGTRPAGRTTAGGGTGPEGDVEPRSVRVARLVSIRTLVLGVVVLVAFSMLFPTVRAYLGQRAALESLAVEVEATEQRQRDLEGELARWRDDAYVAAQARERLSFVLPGEVSYRVIDPEVVVEAPDVDGTAPGAATPTGPALPIGGAVTPWYATVWESVRVAGEAPLPQPEPAEGAPAG